MKSASNSVIESINFGANSPLKTIDTFAFNNCLSLVNLEFGVNSLLETIGASAFAECSSLEVLTLPKKLKSIDSLAFENTYKLNTINFNSTSMNDLSTANIFWNAGSSSANGVIVNVGANVTKIPKSLFENAYRYLKKEDGYYYNVLYPIRVKKVVFENNSACLTIGVNAFCIAHISMKLRYRVQFKQLVKVHSSFVVL